MFLCNISDFMIIFATLAVVSGSVFAIRYLIKLKKRLNTSIILIPLYKPKAFLIIAEIIIFSLIVFDIIFIITAADKLFLLINVLIMLVFVFLLLLTLLIQRFAVIDSGIIVPYRFIDWIEYSDYVIEDNTVFFTGDKNGFSNLSSTTVKLSFNASDINKLEMILSRNKNRLS